MIRLAVNHGVRGRSKVSWRIVELLLGMLLLWIGLNGAIRGIWYSTVAPFGEFTRWPGMFAAVLGLVVIGHALSSLKAR